MWPYLRSGYLKRGKTLAKLARRCGIDPAGLEQTVKEFNSHARVGEDPAFGRGTTAFNRASGDPEHGPNPSLAPIEKPPFYAIKVLPGSFGTSPAYAPTRTRGCSMGTDSPWPAFMPPAATRPTSWVVTTRLAASTSGRP